jgi:hypothetical protein
MAAEFIEVTSRTNSKTVVINTDRIVKVADDGIGALIIVDGIKDIEEHKVSETYAAVKTALGL